MLIRAYFTHGFVVSIVYFEQVNVSWDNNINLTSVSRRLLKLVLKAADLIW